jgi:hypothetical protein
MYEIFEMWKEFVVGPPKENIYCVACGKILLYGNGEKDRATCYKTYSKPDVWLCWSCNYDYKKFAQDTRIETFYAIMKGE